MTILGRALPAFTDGARIVFRCRTSQNSQNDIEAFCARFEVPPRKDHRGVDLISDVLPFGRLWYGDANAVSNAIGYAKHRSRSHHALIRVSR
jgi:hypothetical protein